MTLFILEMAIIRGDLYCCLQLPDRNMQRRWSQTFLRGAQHQEKKGTGHNLKCEISVRHKEKYFCNGSNWNYQIQSRKVVGSSSLEMFKT